MTEENEKNNFFLLELFLEISIIYLREHSTAHGTFLFIFDNTRK